MRKIVVLGLILMGSLCHAQQRQWLPEKQHLLRVGAATVLLGVSYGLHLNVVQPPKATAINFLAYQNLPYYQRNFVGPLDLGWKKTTDVLLYSTLALPLVAGALQSDRMADVWTEYAEVLAYTATLTVLMKTFVAEPRPFAYQTDPNTPLQNLEADANASFFSGHSSMSFVAAGFLYFDGLRHPEKPLWQRRWLPLAGVTLATATAVGRVAAHKHFPHDVVVGAGVGWGMAYLFHRIKKNQNKTSFYAAPMPQGWVAGFQVPF